MTSKNLEEVWEAEFNIDKECKHSRRYASVAKEFPIQTIYVDREVADGKDIFWLSLERRKE